MRWLAQRWDGVTHGSSAKSAAGALARARVWGLALLWLHLCDWWEARRAVLTGENISTRGAPMNMDGGLGVPGGCQKVRLSMEPFAAFGVLLER